MSANVRAIKRRPAKRPAPRTVTATIEEGDFAGWEATAKADFPARVLADFESKKADRIMLALDAIIIDHNFPNENDELAETMADVDPVAGLIAIADQLLTKIGQLPNR